MVSIPSKNVWMRRQQCPCGDLKCFLTHEEDTKEINVVATQLGNSDNAVSDDTMVSPYVGMIFQNDEEAFEYYGNFARRNGFSIRKERSRLSPQLGIYKRDLVCYRSGYAPPRKKPTTEHHRDRKSARCGCDAKMYLSKEVVNGLSQWFVVQFSNVHNHELLEDDQVRLLPAYRKIQEADQERIVLLSKAGFPIHRIVKALELEKGTQGRQLSFSERDVRNFIQNRKKFSQENDASLNEKRENDATDLVEACRAAKEGDPNFVYDVAMDENDKVENIAWSYGDSVRAYSLFGDVVYFDTTYHSMTYGMLFGAWFGIDNHGKTIFFGCVLLQDESVRSFSWALQTFIQFMKGRCPQTVLTDLDPGLRKAIRSELPNTKHVISISNILSKLSCWFSPPLGLRYVDFRTAFDSLNDLDTAEDFDLRWDQIISEYGLISDKHISALFSSRGCWALPFTRGCFLARMGTSVYYKSVDSFLKRIFRAQACLRTFFEQVGVSSTLKTQACREMQYMHTRTCLPIEEHARSTLSPFAFNAFQHEMVLAMKYATSEMANGSFIVRHFQKIDGERLVIWIPENEQILCSCKEYESSGILCRHALRILAIKNYFQLPEKYFPKRWRRDSSLGPHYDYNNQRGNDEWFQEFDSLTGSLFKESAITKERSDFVHKEIKKELTRILKEVKSMPSGDAIVMD